MDPVTVYEHIDRSGIVAGMRGAFGPDAALNVAAIVMNEGINAFELTMNSDQPIEAMQAIKREYGDAAVVGMGTVLDTETARRVLDAGADFVVSPGFQPDVVRLILDAGVMMAPGVTTASEALQAWDMGVSLLKLFPIGVLGLDYFKALYGPLNHMKFMCNGGMNADNAHALIKAGAVAAGMAGWLTGGGAPLPDDVLHLRARQLVNAVRAAKTGQPIPQQV